MNEAFGADLGDADKVWFDQQWVELKSNDMMRAVALDNDRSGFELELERYLADALLDRHEANGNIVDLFFEKPAVKRGLLAFLAGTYDEFRQEAGLSAR